MYKTNKRNLMSLFFQEETPENLKFETCTLALYLDLMLSEYSGLNSIYSNEDLINFVEELKEFVKI